MNRIRLLPEQVANQIAAGEVIERPASVVKELVENALDAEATRITVEIQAGGRSLMRVTDDGVGMSRDDALLCLERHATSKIRRAEDLAAISTMGFRGEALPSIASVSRFTLITREKESDAPEGSRVAVSGGKMIEVKAAGAAPGTSIEVRQLFFNLPARRKFLRSEETESAHIQHYLTLAALAFPHVAFSFQKDSRSVWQLPPMKATTDPEGQSQALRERLRALYGDEQKLVAVDFSAELSPAQEEHHEQGGFDAALPASESTSQSGNIPLNVHSGYARSMLRVWGFIGAPGVSRATRQDQHLFVNRRPVENRGLNFALLEGYHTSLMKGRYPVCCLFLELDPAAVDVNIHPAKREVKFHRESEIRRLVSQAVRDSLLRYHGTANAANSAFSAPQTRAPATHTAGQTIPEPQHEQRQQSIAHLPKLASDEIRTVDATQPALPMGFGTRPHSPSPPLSRDSISSVSPIALTHSTHVKPARAAPATNLASTDPAATKALLSVELRLVGVIGRLYVVLESDRGLVLLDQHAAHERILFEQMLNRLEQKNQAPSQKLLLPETVELSARDAAFVRQQLPVLTRLGVGLSEFGERTFLLDALPPFVKTNNARRFVLELVDELKVSGETVNMLRLGEAVVAKTVCRHAVKANDPLAGRELEQLIEDLRRCAMPYTCPHGRPTLIEMNFRELEKKFGRTQ